MMAFMNFVTTRSPNFGSGLISRFSALWRRDIYFVSQTLWRLTTRRTSRGAGKNVTELLRTLRTVLRTALLAVLDTLGIENAADDVVTHTRQVLDAAATDHHDGVFLQVVTFTRDVADDFEAVGEADLGNL